MSLDKPRPPGLPRAEGAWALAHAGVADDRAQAGASLLPHPARAGSRRARADPDNLTTLDPPLRRPDSKMAPKLPTSSPKPCGSHASVAAQQRPSGRSRSTRNDRSTITSPTIRSRTQISPGIRGANHDPINHNHSPPTLDKGAPVQISRARPDLQGRRRADVGARASGDPRSPPKRAARCASRPPATDRRRPQPRLHR